MDIISQMTPTDWFLVAVVLALVAFTLFIVWLAVQEPLKRLVKRLKERSQERTPEDHRLGDGARR